MRNRTSGCILVVLLLVLASAICSSSPRFVPDHYEYYSIYQGWHDSKPAWFISTAASDIAFASSTFFATMWDPWFPEKPVLAPRLADALSVSPPVARPMYLVANSNQGPIFDTIPGSDDYSGLWQVFLIRFSPGFVRAVCNTSTSDPNGLPSPAEGEIIETDTVLDAPIVATGPLGGPPYPGPKGYYRIPQAAGYALYTIPKAVLLPVYSAYVTNPFNGRPWVVGVSVTEADTQDLAGMFGATFAPNLAAFPDSSTKNFWVIRQGPPAQFPVLEEAPTWQARPYNPLYSPIMRYSKLKKLMPGSSVISSPHTLQMLLNSGRLVEISVGQHINVNIPQVQ